MADPLQIAYFSPLPPARSGIADYSAELLPSLAGKAEVTLFVDEPATVDAPLGLVVRPLSAFPAERWAYDLPLYQMGNSAHHTSIYQTLCRYPGVVVLHDYFLHHFMAHTTTGAGNYPAYARELRYALREDGTAREESIRLGHEPPPLDELPLNERLLDVSLALIVHSEYAAARIRERNPAAKVAVVPQLVASREGRSRRAELGVPDGPIVFGLLGQVTAAKQLPRVLRALATLDREGLPIHLLIAGEVLPEVDLERLLAETGTTSLVTSLGYVDLLDAFVDWIATADVVVNLRHPTLGETSSAALRALDQGRPLIVYDHGWYAELPDEVATKVPPLEDEALLAAMRELASDKLRREQIGAAARRFVATTSSPDAVAQQYVGFLRQLQAEWLRRG